MISYKVVSLTLHEWAHVMSVVALMWIPSEEHVETALEKGLLKSGINEPR